MNFPSMLTLLALLGLSCSTANGQTTAEPAQPNTATPAPAPVVPHAQVSHRAIEDLQGALKQSIAKVGPAVVTVFSSKTVKQRGMPGTPFDFCFDPRPSGPREFKQEGMGSGFVIDAAGHILTNNHVVESADEIKVKFSDDREVTAKVVGTDPPTDLALLKIDDPRVTPVALGDSDHLEVGDWVLAIGNPFGLPQTVSAGIVSAVGRANVGIVDYEDFIQTDAAVNPGNSGGPLVDLQGRVVGINTAIASRTGGNNGIAFAIPINMAKDVVEQLLARGSVTRGHIGIIISDLDPEMAKTFEYTGSKGILVQDVAPDSPASQAGLRGGDIITSLDGQPVTALARFRAEIAKKAPGTAVKLGVWRDKKAIVVDVKLGSLNRPTPGAPPPQVGVQLRDVTPPIAQQLGLERAEGVVITEVEPGSPAAAAGLQPGDLLEQIGKDRVRNAKDAVEKLKSVDLKAGVRLRIRRGDTGQYVLLKDR